MLNLYHDKLIKMMSHICFHIWTIIIFFSFYSLKTKIKTSLFKSGCFGRYVFCFLLEDFFNVFFCLLFVSESFDFHFNTPIPFCICYIDVILRFLLLIFWAFIHYFLNLIFNFYSTF